MCLYASFNSFSLLQINTLAFQLCIVGVFDFVIMGNLTDLGISPLLTSSVFGIFSPQD